MKVSSNSSYFCLALFLLGFHVVSFSQQTTLVAELTGNPPDISEWTATNVDIEGEELVLTQATGDATGAIFFSQPYNLNQCSQWKVEYDFRLFDGGGADGLAFYYLEDPPTTFGGGQSIGLPPNSRGLKVIFDTYNNDSGTGNPNPELQVYYGEGYEETFPSPDMLKAQIPNIRSDDYQHAEIDWDNGSIVVKINGVEVLSGNPTPFDGVENILAGYFGFSASTGAITDRQSIKNVQVYVNAIQLDNDETSITACDQNGDGFAEFDLTSVADLFSLTGDFSYYTSLNDAGMATNPIPDADLSSYTNDTAFANQIIYVRIENDEGCYALGRIHLMLASPPDVNKNLVTVPGTCDLDQDGSESYDLTQAETEFLDNPGDFDISYFESQSDAQNGDAGLAISTPTDFPVQAGATKTVYVRIENQGCFTVVAITLETFVTPEIESVEQLTECDNSSGNYSFDLTMNAPNILGNQNPADITITYFTTQDDADNDQNPVADETAFEVDSGCETIYVRVENSNHTDCYTTADFQVCGIDISIGAPQNLSQCSSGGNGLPFYDLTQNNGDIIGGQDPSLFNVSYYKTMDDADNAQNAIANPSNYQAENSPQTIYVRLENDQNPNCYALESFVIDSTQITIGTPENLSQCALVDVGLPTFDLTQNNDDVLNGDDPTNYEVNFYTSMDDAENGQNPIDDPENYQADNYPQTIYVRLDKVQDPGCYALESFTLKSIDVNVVELEALVTCKNESSTYDLTETEQQLNLSQDQEIVGYYAALSDLNTGQNPIENPDEFNYSENVQQVYIKVEGGEGCFGVYAVPLSTKPCELKIPEGFSPNGDGVNDKFEISNLSDSHPNFKLKIFSRYGRIVYEGNNGKQPWDGNSENGDEVPTGTYYYVLNLHDAGADVVKGWVYLNR